MEAVIFPDFAGLFPFGKFPDVFPVQAESFRKDLACFGFRSAFLQHGARFFHGFIMPLVQCPFEFRQLVLREQFASGVEPGEDRIAEFPRSKFFRKFRAQERHGHGRLLFKHTKSTSNKPKDNWR